MALTILMCVEFLEQGEEAMPKCEHGLTSKECYVCASPKHAEQAEKQEPVAWRTPNWGHGPDEWAYFDADDRPTGANGPTGEALYTTPQPQREWVGLTLEEKKEYLAQDFGGSRSDAMDWADKRLKEKNT